MRDTIELAREAGGRAQQNKNCDVEYLMSADALKAFEALVRADERVQERKKWMQLFTDPENQPSQFGTVTLDFMQSEIKAEREACAKVCVKISNEFKSMYCGDEMEAALICEKTIRARGNT